MKTILAALLALTIPALCQNPAPTAKSSAEELREIRKTLPVIKKQEVYIQRTLEGKLFACDYRTKEGRVFPLLDLDRNEYIEFCKELIADPDQQKVSDLCKQMLVGILNLEQKPESHGFLELGGQFNRSIIFAMTAVHNRLKLDEDDIRRFNAECVTYSGKAKENDRPIIMAIFAAIFADNEKL